MATEKKQVKTKFYIALKKVDEKDKCPPQAKLIMSTIEEAGGKVERDELIKLLSRPVDQGGLKTNQTAERILGFYRPKLAGMGVLKEDVVVTEVEVEVPDKPTKAVAAADTAASPTAPVPAAAGKGKDVKGTKKVA